MDIEVPYKLAQLINSYCSATVPHHQTHGPTRRTPITNRGYFSQRDNSTTIVSINRIKEVLESLKLIDSINYTKTAKEYGVNRTTLSKRY